MTKLRELASSFLPNVLLFALAGGLGACALSRQGDAISAIRTLVEGVYTLEESHAEGKVSTPPQIEGRVVYLNGTTLFILHNRTRPPAQTSVASWGDYTLTEKEFSFRYTEPSTVTITPGTVTHQRRLPFEGYRSYIVERDGVNVRFKGKATPQEFLFTPTSLIFTEGNPASPSAKRVYRRIAGP